LRREKLNYWSGPERTLSSLQQADVIVYDRLVSIGILDMARRNAEKIYLGKQRDNHSLPQESINQLLIDLALPANGSPD